MIFDRVAFDLPAYEGLLAGHYVREAGYARRRIGGTDDWLLVATLAGEGRFASETGEVTATPGTLVLIAPGTTHDYGTTSGWELLWVHVHPPAAWLDLMRWPLAGPGIGLVVPIGFSEAEAAFRDIVRLAPTRRRLAMNALERLLLLVEEERPPESPLDGRVRQMAEWVEGHLGEPLAIDRLAALVALSPSRFAHLFRTETGLAPMSYVAQRRMERARRLLDGTTLGVTEVAAAVGMEPFHFSSRFKAATGVSPRAYRERKRWDVPPSSSRSEGKV